MKILVISDTHVPINENSLPQIILDQAKKSDCCIHAGDFINYTTFKQLSEITQVYGVSGNMDENAIKKLLPTKQIFNLEKIKIALIHGRGSPNTILDYVNNEFASQQKTIDLFIFGHSHSALDITIAGKRYFNPGSPTDTIFAKFRSYGIIEIKETMIKSSIVTIKE